MKRAILTLSILAVAAGASFAGVTKEDLKKLVAAGVSDDVIAAFIRANGPVDPLSADDVVDLKKAGATDKLLQSVLAPAQAPAPAAQPVMPPTYQQEQRIAERERLVYVDRPVYTQPLQPRYVDYYVPSTTYTYYPSYSTYSYYPRYSTYGSCWPRTTYYSGHHHHHSRHHHHSGFSLGIGW